MWDLNNGREKRSKWVDNNIDDDWSCFDRQEWIAKQPRVSFSTWRAGPYINSVPRPKISILHQPFSGSPKGTVTPGSRVWQRSWQLGVSIHSSKKALESNAACLWISILETLLCFLQMEASHVHFVKNLFEILLESFRKFIPCTAYAMGHQQLAGFSGDNKPLTWGFHNAILTTHDWEWCPNL